MKQSLKSSLKLIGLGALLLVSIILMEMALWSEKSCGLIDLVLFRDVFRSKKCSGFYFYSARIMSLLVVAVGVVGLVCHMINSVISGRNNGST